jgi:UDP-3-O-[3-hydroxymyristoyl] glucosamine N-acyltransferase LpxD
MSQPVSAKQIVDFLEREHRGEVGFEVSRTGSPDDPLPNSLLFLKRLEPQWREKLAGASPQILLLVSVSLEAQCADLPQARVASPNPRLDFARAVSRFLTKPTNTHAIPESGWHPTAVVDPEAEVAASARIGAYAVIGKSTIGPGVVIHPHTHVCDGVEIGDRSEIHGACTIGTEGFGFELSDQGRWEHLPQTGRLVIEEDVEIFPGCNVDRSAVGDTVIGRGTKIDHHCHIAHGAKIGPHCVITAGVVFSGTVTLGAYTWIGPNASLRQGIVLGENVLVGIGAVVTKSFPDNVIVAGVPAKVMREQEPLAFRAPASS